MPRNPRGVSPDGIYHVTARGNRRQPIFFDDHDRQLFLRILGDSVSRHGWECAAYCLLSNHFHLLIRTTGSPTALSAGMHRLNGRYAQWFNDRHGLDGHLFQGRFHSTLIQTEGHLLAAVRYVLRNPVSAGLCESPSDWAWSSCAATLRAGGAPGFLAGELILGLFGRDPALARRQLTAFLADELPVL